MLGYNSVFRSTWGIIKEAGGIHDLGAPLLSSLKAQGYAGVEIPVKLVLSYGVKPWAETLASTGMKAIYMAFSDGPMAPGHPTFGGPFPGARAHVPLWEYRFYDISVLSSRARVYACLCVRLLFKFTRRARFV